MAALSVLYDFGSDEARRFNYSWHVGIYDISGRCKLLVREVAYICSRLPLPTLMSTATSADNCGEPVVELFLFGGIRTAANIGCETGDDRQLICTL